MTVPHYTIRKARPEDAHILAEVEREIAKIPGRLASRPDELKDDAFRQKIVALSDGNSGLYIVIEENGKILGHAFLEQRDLAVTAHVFYLSIAICEGYQGKGLGKHLMEHLIAWAKSNSKVEKIELHVRSCNQIAITLYKNLGFQEEGRKIKSIKLGHNNYLDDVYMALWVGDEIC